MNRFDVNKMEDLDLHYVVLYYADDSYLCKDENIAANLNMDVHDYRERMAEFGGMQREVFTVMVFRREWQARQAIEKFLDPMMTLALLEDAEDKFGDDSPF